MGLCEPMPLASLYMRRGRSGEQCCPAAQVVPRDEGVLPRQLEEAWFPDMVWVLKRFTFIHLAFVFASKQSVV